MISTRRCQLCSFSNKISFTQACAFGSLPMFHPCSRYARMYRRMLPLRHRSGRSLYTFPNISQASKRFLVGARMSGTVQHWPGLFLYLCLSRNQGHPDQTYNSSWLATICPLSSRSVFILSTISDVKYLVLRRRTSSPRMEDEWSRLLQFYKSDDVGSLRHRKFIYRNVKRFRKPMVKVQSFFSANPTFIIELC